MPVIDMGALLRPPFAESQFIATKWEDAAGKAHFANTLCRFIAADFKQSLFTKKLYGRLSLTFGHIAHFNLHGFFEHFFRDQQGKAAFLEQTLTWPAYGDPEYTFSDVERAVQTRLRACKVLEAYRALLAGEVEQTERAQFALLRRKYDGHEAPAPSSVPACLHSALVSEMCKALELCEDALAELSRLDDGTCSTSALFAAREVLAKARSRTG